MGALTYTNYGEATGDMKFKVITADVTSATDTITITDMRTIYYVHAYVSGTEATALDVTISNNIITTAGWSSSTETWILFIGGI